VLDSRPILSVARANRPALRQGSAIPRRLTRLKEATDRGIIPRVRPSLEELRTAGLQIGDPGIRRQRGEADHTRQPSIADLWKSLTSKT
jgi:hypothetical protein